jgi:hypothetical protein
MKELISAMDEEIEQDYEDAGAKNIAKSIRKIKRNKKGRGRFPFSNSENLNEVVLKLGELSRC